MSEQFNPMKVGDAKGNPKMAKKTTPAKKDTAAAAAPAKEKPGIGHNATGLDETQEKVFIRELQNVKDSDTQMASIKGVIGGIYKRLEQAGFSKDHIKWAQMLEKQNVSEVIRDLRMKISIAKLLGHAAGRQLDLIDDRTPLEDQAYLEGLAAGKLGRDAANPYGMETIAGQRWTVGMNEGNVLRNAALNEAVNGNSAGSEIIKGSTDEGSEENDDDVDGSGGVDGVDGEGEIADQAGDAGSETRSGSASDVVEGEVLGDDDWDNETPPPRIIN